MNILFRFKSLNSLILQILIQTFGTSYFKTEKFVVDQCNALTRKGTQILVKKTFIYYLHFFLFNPKPIVSDKHPKVNSNNALLI